MKNSNKIKNELEFAKAELVKTESRARELEQAGDASEKAITEMTTAIGKARLLKGAITRLEGEFTTALIQDLEAEIIECRATMATEEKNIAKATDKLVVQVSKILIPAVGTTPLWTDQFIERRTQEIRVLCRQVPSVVVHVDAYQNAKVQIEKDYAKLRELKGIPA